MKTRPDHIVHRPRRGPDLRCLPFRRSRWKRRRSNSLPVSFISDKDFTKMTQGAKNAPQLKLELPKPLADKVDAPKAVDLLAPKVVDKPAITTDTSKPKSEPKPDVKAETTKPKADPKPEAKADPKPDPKPSQARNRRRRSTNPIRSPIS